MNWDAIGAIAELLGAIGVIASLVYLATQIRHSREQMSQNTRALRAGSYQQYHETQGATFLKALEVPGLDSAVRLGLADFHQLNEEDAFRFNFWITSVMYQYDNGQYQFRVGLLDEDRWQMHLSGLKVMLQSPGFAQWWRTNAMTASFAPEFVALVEEILGEESEGTDQTQ
jgi:hypothetical protein